MFLSTNVEQVSIPTPHGAMDGVLWLPDNPVGIVLLADGRSGYRVKPPIDYVGTVLRNARLGTFWLDLSRQGEGGNEPDRLALRLEAACDWLREHQSAGSMPVGLFGAGNGVAAVLQLAAKLGSQVSAIVLRGGRADMAAHTCLPRVTAPTLLIAGSLDERVVSVSRVVYSSLRCKKRLEIIPGATHSFEEPGSLEVVARLARGWFLQNARVRHV
ncbi:dienelactone hydrolase family protein [Noviherbaspirillum sp.]|uniref:dienelactone hydrolase family protein n=1 Tax=Noviherbaspirillum sp. TaxID=1926288 RepID=UPI002D6F3912|nr:alpha/beta hydrolase [Noviherbaspirillum sp.]HZW21473.1 alpha/beta hydrolase [Noviherbaspirillum sp.]